MKDVCRLNSNDCGHCVLLIDQSFTSMTHCSVTCLVIPPGGALDFEI